MTKGVSGGSAFGLWTKRRSKRPYRWRDRTFLRAFDRVLRARTGIRLAVRPTVLGRRAFVDEKIDETGAAARISSIGRRWSRRRFRSRNFIRLDYYQVRIGEMRAIFISDNDLERVGIHRIALNDCSRHRRSR
jgi:hypothetical protein